MSRLTFVFVMLAMAFVCLAMAVTHSNRINPVVTSIPIPDIDSHDVMVRSRAIADSAAMRARLDREDAASNVYLKEIACLSMNTYFESRNQGPKGMSAVAAVTVNRANDKSMSICEVVFEPWQFSWTGDENLETFDVATMNSTDRKSYRTAISIADMFYKMCIEKDSASAECRQLDPTGGATFYHTKTVSPFWSKPKHKFVSTTTIKDHVFYKGPAGR